MPELYDPTKGGGVLGRGVPGVVWRTYVGRGLLAGGLLLPAHRALPTAVLALQARCAIRSVCRKLWVLCGPLLSVSWSNHHRSSAHPPCPVCECGAGLTGRDIPHISYSVHFSCLQVRLRSP